MESKTSLYDNHLSFGGKMVPFADYLLPVHYTAGIIAEHNAVRTAAGLFDVSHMAEISFSGKDALRNLNYLLTNDFSSMVDGQVRYSVMCNEQGGCIDDLIVYRFNEQLYTVVVNAANRWKDFFWVNRKAFGEVTILDESENWSQLALQGPLSKEILLEFVSESELPEKYYTFRDEVYIRGMYSFISRTGYTGEDGYEIYLNNLNARILWNLLLEAGKGKGLLPCGLGARDTLRLEAAMPLYGHEMNEQITPLETGLSFAVKMQKENFIGKKALEAMGAPTRKRIGLKITGRGIARENQDVYAAGVLIGQTTSGTHAPFLKYPIAMALVSAGSVETGAQVEIDVRGRRITAEVVPLPFYKRAK